MTLRRYCGGIVIIVSFDVERGLRAKGSEFLVLGGTEPRGRLARGRDGVTAVVVHRVTVNSGERRRRAGRRAGRDNLDSRP